MSDKQPRGPNGGTIIEAVWFARDGTRLDGPQLASAGEIHEQLPDGRILRTYVAGMLDDPSDGVAPIAAGTVEYDAQSADLLKSGTYDIYAVEDGHPVLADTLARVMRALGWDRLPIDGQREAVAHWMTLPSFVPAPASLKEECSRFLVSTRIG